jgi:alginate O-acetyltransferase complex protein AlgJ
VGERLNRPREEQARRELGCTDVGAGTAWLLVGAFLLSIVSVGGIQQLSAHTGLGTAGVDDRSAAEGVEDGSGAAPLRWATLWSELPTDCSLEAFERELEGALVVGGWALPGVQFILTRFLGTGNEQVYTGRGGWLFHRASVEYPSGPPFLDPTRLEARRTDSDHCEPPPQPDPIPAIRLFNDQLAARGIRLIVMPTPAKAVVHPDAFSRRYADRAGPVQNPSFRDFLERLEAIGVPVFDPTPLLLEWERESGDLSAYLATDTHWRPEAMAAVADGLAAVVVQQGELSEPASVPYTRGRLAVSNFGDLTTMLTLPPDQAVFPPERLSIAPIRGTDGQRWQPQADAEVLLLGDSFSNVYSNREAFTNRTAGREYHWGEDAGLAEQLSFALQRPVDRIVRNAGGSHTTRLDLARSIAGERARGRDRLRNVRVVVYQFAGRELASGDWQLIELPAPPEAPAEAPREPGPAAAPGERTIRATIAARASLPRPYTVPYKDCLFALHLTAVEVTSGESLAGEVVAYLWGMRDNVWTGAAGYRVGQEITLRVRSWEEPEVQERYGTHNRKELDDPALLALPAFWAEQGD